MGAAIPKQPSPSKEMTLEERVAKLEKEVAELRKQAFGHNPGDE